MYRQALRRGGSAPGEAVHVGNSLVNDVQGAQGTGIHAVWLNRRGIANDTTIQPDAVVSLERSNILGRRCIVVAEWMEG